MEIIEDKAFSNETVELDGRGFIRCSFIGCHLIFRGKEAFGLRDYRLSNTTMEFADNAALTIQAIGLLYRAGGSLKKWVEYEVESGFSGVLKPNLN